MHEWCRQVTLRNDAYKVIMQCLCGWFLGTRRDEQKLLGKWCIQEQWIEISLHVWIKENTSCECILLFKDNCGKYWWRGKCKEGLTVKENQAWVTIYKCLTRTLTMIRLVQSVYKMIYGWRLLCKVEIWGLDDGWKEIDGVWVRFGKMFLRIPTRAVNVKNWIRIG